VWPGLHPLSPPAVTVPTALVTRSNPRISSVALPATVGDDGLHYFLLTLHDAPLCAS
jgi:hypothetical protein